jgi:hypothetical protein
MNKTFAPILEIAIRESLKNYESKNEGNSLGDLYLQYNNEDNTLIILDDMDNVLNSVQLSDNFPFSASLLRNVLQQVEKNNLFVKEYIVKPFAVNLIDKDFRIIEELLFLDDDTIKISENRNIWPTIEKELDDFLIDLFH